MNQSLTERVTRLLAFMLRHQPEQFDLEIDAFGFADVEDVLDALSERVDDDLEIEDLESAIEAGDRPRYEIEKGRIRALYGHSIAVEPGEPAQPPELLYVGLPAREAERAGEYGLRSGRRRFLHLALTSEDAMDTGRRSAVEYNVITIDALDAWEDGINFYDRKSLFLAEEIPTNLLEVGPVHTDGEAPIERDGRGSRRGRDADRGRGGRGGRGSSESTESRETRETRDTRGEQTERSGSDRGDRSEQGGRGERTASRTSRERTPAPERESRGRSDDRGGDRGRSPRGRGGRAGAGRDGSRTSRPERAPREEVPVEVTASVASRRSDTIEPAPKASSSSGFGKGIYGGEAAESKPAKARRQTPKPVETVAPEPKQQAEVRSEEPPSSFGAGLE